MTTPAGPDGIVSADRTGKYPDGDIKFENHGAPGSLQLEQGPGAPAEQVVPITPFPPAIIRLSADNDKHEEYLNDFKIWLDMSWVRLDADRAKLQDKWADIEDAYRALPGASKSFPFDGACSDTIPVIAMAVDPVHARLDTSVFKEQPVISLKALKKSMKKYVDPMQRWIEFYQRHILKLRQVVSPQLLQCGKLGTAVFKTVYDEETSRINTYDKDWKVIQKTVTGFKGPRVTGINIDNFYFDPGYQHFQDCPISMERIRTTWYKLKVQEAADKLTNVDVLKGFRRFDRSETEEAREKASEHERTVESTMTLNKGWDGAVTVWEVWCEYDVNNDGIPERVIATYHRETRTILQLRYNWYFNQRKPYTVLPFLITADSILGLGIGEMALPFQEAITRWHRMASDNAYIANIRMFIAKKDSGIEEVPRLYAGRTFFVDDPTRDFIPFGAGEIYHSTMNERQNLFGMLEKRTGVSDYLTGRESPIIGTRATATSTLALIREGTIRVEEVLENVRAALSEIVLNMIDIWIQYGPGDVDELVFTDDDDMVALVKEFFATMRPENVRGAMAVDLTVSDAQTNKQTMQQMQLSIIQIMMGYLEKLLEAGQLALTSLQQGQPIMAQMVADTMTSARSMFSDLLKDYEITDPDTYLPDLRKYVDAASQQLSAGGGPQGQPGGPQGAPGLPTPPAAASVPAGPRPATPGSGGRPNPAEAVAGASTFS